MSPPLWTARGTQTTIRALAAGLGTTAVAVGGYMFWLVATGGDPATTRAYFALMALTGTLAGGLAVLVALRARAGGDTATFALFLGATGLAVADEGEFWLLQVLLDLEGPGTGADAWTPVLFFAALATGWAAAVRLAQLFPRPLARDDLRDAPGPAAFRRLLATSLGPRPAWLGFGLAGWLAMAAAERWLSAAITIQLMLAMNLLVLTLAAGYLRTAHRRGDTADRRRVIWFLEAGLVAMATFALAVWVELAVHGFGAGAPLVRWLHAILLPLGLLSTIGILAVGVLYRGALDSRLVVRRTLLYGALGFVLTVVFVGVETLVEELLAARLHLPDRAGSYVAGILAAVVFGPVRNALERRLPRREERGAERVSPAAPGG